MTGQNLPTCSAQYISGDCIYLCAVKLEDGKCHTFVCGNVTSKWVICEISLRPLWRMKSTCCLDAMWQKGCDVASNAHRKIDFTGIEFWTKTMIVWRYPSCGIQWFMDTFPPQTHICSSVTGRRRKSLMKDKRIEPLISRGPALWSIRHRPEIKDLSSVRGGSGTVHRLQTCMR